MAKLSANGKCHAGMPRKIEVARCCKSMRLTVRIASDIYNTYVTVRCKQCGLNGAAVVLSLEQMKTWQNTCDQHIVEAFKYWNKTVKYKEARNEIRS